jgi:hypothetical protein
MTGGMADNSTKNIAIQNMNAIREKSAYLPSKHEKHTAIAVDLGKFQGDSVKG